MKNVYKEIADIKARLDVLEGKQPEAQAEPELEKKDTSANKKKKK